MTFALQTIATTPVVGGLTVESLLILVSMAAALVFVVIYPILSDPRTWTREGWHMWCFTLALFSLGGASITRRLWPDAVDAPVYTAAILITYGALAVLLWQRVWLLWTARRHDQILHERARARPAPPEERP